MQKRLLRLSTQIQIRQQVTEFVGKKINIVLKNNSVVLAELLTFSDTELWVQNMRGQKLSVPFTDIYEIIIDITA